MSPTWLHWPSTWTPDDLTSLRAWYDADDSSTIFDATTGGSLPSSGNDVARWEDKSGGGYHVTQATAANRPHYVTNTLNGRPVIECTAQWLTASTASDWTFLHDATGSTVATVWQAGASSNPDAAYGLFGTSDAVNSNIGTVLFWDDRAFVSRNEVLVSTVAYGSAGNWTVANVTANGAMTPNAPHVLTLTTDPANSTTANRSIIRVDAINKSNIVSSSSTYSTASPTYPLQLGNVGNGLFPLTGYIAELIVCDTVVSSGDREKLEGYLAHKWGLESNLPSTHPYKNSAP